METVTLFFYETDDIRISIQAYFEGGRLVIDGYDIGKRVKEYWGDSDYEYVVKIPAEGVAFLFKHLEVEGSDHSVLLNALASRYNTNSCYSDIWKLMDDNGIKCEGSTWV